MPEPAEYLSSVANLEILGRDWPNLIAFSAPTSGREAVQTDKIFRIELDTLLTAGQWNQVKAALKGSTPDRKRAAQLLIDSRSGDKPGVPQFIRLALDPDTYFCCKHPWEKEPDDDDDCDHTTDTASTRTVGPKARINVLEDFAQAATPQAVVRLILDVPFNPQTTKTVEEVEALLEDDLPGLKAFVEEQAGYPAGLEKGIIDAFFA